MYFICYINYIKENSMDNINKYRHKQGLSEISEKEKKRLAFEI